MLVYCRTNTIFYVIKSITLSPCASCYGTNWVLVQLIAPITLLHIKRGSWIYKQNCNIFYTLPQLFALKLLISITRISTTNSWIKNRVNTLKIVCNMRIIKITIVFPQKTLLLYCLLWENIANATFCFLQFAGHHFAELPLEHCVFSCENWPIAISFSWLSTNGILICTQNSMKYANGSKKV